MADLVIFGIKVNGQSQSMVELTIDDDQSKYDLICNVSLSSTDNGNNSFTISFLSKDLVEGLPIAGWYLLDAYFNSCWVSSTAYFRLMDESGEYIKRWLKVKLDLGTHKMGYIESMTRSVIATARKIIGEFPSAKVYDAYKEFIESIPYESTLFNIGNDPIRAIESFNESILKLSKCIQSFQKIRALLKDKEDVKSKRILKKVNDRFLEVMGSLGYKPSI